MTVNHLYETTYASTYTHCEIHPAMMLGVSASIIPFPDHNQSPRNTYQSAMGKQAMGIYASNYQARMDSLGHVLYYPQRPLVCSRSMKYIFFKSLPAGFNAIAAITCFTGYNQEDSLIFNRGAVDRGLFRSVFYRTYTKAESSAMNMSTKEKIMKPNPQSTSGQKMESYDKLDSDGLILPGTAVSGNDIIIGMVVEDDVKNIEKAGKKLYRDCSISLR
mmetsp:Transcript_25512/g.22515  ORF Transcript_25512/g.22515 Transcript_25512/m.22515 type:complete len:218 (-) Transcript_25512:186-839(-)